MWHSGGMSRTLYRDAALADGTGPHPRLGVSVLAEIGHSELRGGLRRVVKSGCVGA